MPTFTFKSPDGQTYRVNGPEGATEADAFKILQSQLGGSTGAATGAGGGSLPPAPANARGADSGLAGTGSPSPETYDPAAGMNFAEKALVGIGGGMRNAYLGAKNLVGLGSEEERQERMDWKKSKENLGGWGTAGEIAGEMIATAPLGGVVGSGAKVLTKALPAASRLGSVGGRVANLGLVGRAATEGALSAGVVGDAEDRGAMDRLDNLALGGVTGGTVAGALPLAVSAVKGTGKYLAREALPTVGATQGRAVRALERTLGKDKLGQIAQQVSNPTPSMFPRTTAATAQDARLGALERGARSRGNVDFSPHDESVSRAAWEAVQGATSAADEIDNLVKGGTDIMVEGKELLNKLPLSQDRRAAISQEMLALRNSNEVIANPQLAKELDNVIAAVDNPEATLEVLPQLYWRLGQEAGDSSTIQRAREVLKQAADERSKGQFTNMQAGYGATMEQLGGAEAAKAMRERLVKDQIASTNQFYGSTGQDVVPHMSSGPLRRSMIAEAKKGRLGELGQDNMDTLNIVADQLKAHEIYTPAMSSGGAGVNLGGGEGAASAALNAGPLWRLRGALGSYFGDLNERSVKMIDEALLEPQKFLDLMQKREAAGAPLGPVEKTLKQLLLGGGRSAAVSTDSEY